MRIIFIILLIFIVLMTILFSSCKILSKSHTVKSDTTSLNKVDSTTVKKGETSAKYDSTWWREIISFLPKGRDSIINNTTVPINNYYPTQIVREGGTISQEWLKKYLDSANKANTDSTSVSKLDQSSSTKAELLSPFQIIAICVGASLLITLLSKLKISFVRK